MSSWDDSRTPARKRPQQEKTRCYPGGSRGRRSCTGYGRLPRGRTSARNPAEEVRSTYATHLQGIKSENLTAVADMKQTRRSCSREWLLVLSANTLGLRKIKVLYDVILSPDVF